MRDVLVVFLADALDEVGIRDQAPCQLDVPGLRVRLRVVDRDVDVDAANGRPGKTFRYPQRFRCRQSAHVEPGLAVLFDGLDDQGVLVPLADRVAHPGWLRIFWQRPAVREDLAVDGAGLV